MFTLRPSHLDEITYLLFEEVKHRQSESNNSARHFLAHSVASGQSRLRRWVQVVHRAQSQTLIQGTSIARIAHHPPLTKLVPNLRYLENAAERTVLDLNVRFFCLGDTLRGFGLWSFRSVWLIIVERNSDLRVFLMNSAIIPSNWMKLAYASSHSHSNFWLHTVMQ